MITENAKFVLKPYLLKELAILYGMTPKAFKGFIRDFEDEIGRKRGRSPYTIHQVEKIIKCVGLPRTIEVSKKSPEVAFYKAS